MILTDREITISLERGLITIDPRPKENFFSSTAVDLTLDPVLARFIATSGGIDITLDPSHADFKAEEALTKLSGINHDTQRGFQWPQKH